MNPFDILNIPPTNDKMAIRRAYVRQIKNNHPDHGGDHNVMLQITNAYESLINGAPHKPKNIVSTEIKLPLNNFLEGCIATVIIDKITVEFTVPPFTYPGTILEFVASNLTTHKVRVKLLEDSSLWYRRIESNIIISRQINKQEAIAGKTIEVINFDGIKHSVTIAKGTTVDKMTFQISNAGFVKPNSQSRGNLTIIIDIQKEGN